MTRASRIDDFTFLTRDSFLLVRPTGRFEVYTFMEPVKISTRPLIRVTYKFPALSDGYMYWYISMSSNPAPGYVPHARFDADNNSATPGGNRQIYYPNPDERIHACCLYVFNPTIDENQHHHEIHSFVFFLNIQNLLNPPAAWLAKKPSTLFYKSPPLSARRTARNAVAAMDASSESGSANSSLVAPPNSPTMPSSSLFTPIYPPFPTFNPFPTVPSGPIPSLVNLSSSVSSSASSSCGSGSPRTPIASLAPGVNIPWEVWGPQSTRWFEECLNTDWQHAIYGLRTVESFRVPKQRDRNFSGLSSPPTQQANSSIPNGTNSTKVAYKSVAVQATEGSSSATSVDVKEDSITQLPSTTQEDNGEESEESEDDNDVNAIRMPRERSLLRVRDFNPYSFTKVSDFGSESLKGKGKHNARWRAPRLVTETSKMSAKGVFARDIESSLPYMEVVSEDTFDVTDVMMDDCRLLLLKVGFLF